MAKYTQTDIELLADEIRHAKDNRPFSLLTGAGCSQSAGIPLAAALVKQLNNEDAFKHHLRSLSEVQRKDYGQCMRKLPKNCRKDLLQPYLDAAKVNWAHIAIASMIRAGYIQRVLTFNFDNVLSRACGLCGKYPAIYDFVTGVSASTDHLSNPCIIHLHGQGTGLAMLNSDDETQKHAERIVPLLRDTFNHSPLLTIGYSGKSDKVFDKIVEQFDGREKLHWCGYEEQAESHIKQLLGKHPDLSKYYGEADADLFLIQLAQELDCFPPPVFSNPLDHLREEIVAVCEYPTSKDTSVNVLANLTKKLDNYENNISTDSEDLEENEAMQLLLKGEYDEIYQRSQVPGNDIPQDILEKAIFNQAHSLYVLAEKKEYEKEDKIAMFKQSCNKYKELIELNSKEVSAFNNWGNALHALGKQTKDPEWFTLSCEKYAQATKLDSEYIIAFNNWGNALKDLGKQTKELYLFTQSFEKYTQAIDLDSELAITYDNWGSSLLVLWSINKDNALLDQVKTLLEKSLKLEPDNAFNMACLMSIKGEDALCEEHLTTCLNAETLPDKLHLMQDTDLDNMRDKAWFKAFLDKLDD